MSIEISHNAEEQQYEIFVDGAKAGVTVAREDGDTLAFTHTEIDERYEGQGLASKLVGFALDDARLRGKKVAAHCPYVKRFISKRDQYADLLV